MSALAFDPVRARTAARQLLRTADRLSADLVDLQRRFVELQLGWYSWETRRRLERATTTLWHDATFLALVTEQVVDADAVGDVDDLWQTAVGPVGRRGVLGPWRDVLGASPAGGDLGGTFDREARRPFVSPGGTDARRARTLLARLLADVATSSQIRADEFQLVQLADDRFIVVLPGVTDLSDVDPFLSDSHRSVRDLDQYAVRSSRSTSVGDNRYAWMVWEALETVDVPDGAELMIVGHSFGADAALDLASDRRFNGDRFRVTHVVAAGYHSQPQLADVAAGTEVLVLQNRHDLVVAAERLGRSSVVDSVVGRVRQLGDVLRLDPGAAVDRARQIVRADFDALSEIGDYAIAHADDVSEIAIGAATRDVARTKDAAAELVASEPRVERWSNGVVVDVFDGGSTGAGHDPSNYIAHLTGDDTGDDTGNDALDPAVVEVLTSIGRAGYAGPGSAVAIDISVP
jgi:hypothetical protein